MNPKRIAAAFGLLGLLGLGAATMLRAQEEAKPASPSRIERRSRLATLRAEVELLQLQHDEDVDRLKKGIKDVATLDELEACKDALDKRMPELRARLGVDDQAEANIDKESALNAMTADVARPYVEGMKKRFLVRSAELARKRLELADLEAVYAAAR